VKVGITTKLKMVLES